MSYDKWGTVFLEHPGLRSGRFSFAVLITSAGAGCGAGVGFADADQFPPESKNLGAAPSSWCYSKTGKFSFGQTFEPCALLRFVSPAARARPCRCRCRGPRRRQSAARLIRCSRARTLTPCAPFGPTAPVAACHRRLQTACPMRRATS
jgi:hypothetical protein